MLLDLMELVVDRFVAVGRYTHAMAARYKAENELGACKGLS